MRDKFKRNIFKNQGFSLLELLIGMSLMGLAVVTMTKYFDMNSSLFKKDQVNLQYAEIKDSINLSLQTKETCASTDLFKDKIMRKRTSATKEVSEAKLENNVEVILGGDLKALKIKNMFTTLLSDAFPNKLSFEIEAAQMSAISFEDISVDESKSKNIIDASINLTVTLKDSVRALNKKKFQHREFLSFYTERDGPSGGKFIIKDCFLNESEKDKKRKDIQDAQESKNVKVSSPQESIKLEPRQEKEYSLEEFTYIEVNGQVDDGDDSGFNGKIMKDKDNNIMFVAAGKEGDIKVDQLIANEEKCLNYRNSAGDTLLCVEYIEAEDSGEKSLKLKNGTHDDPVSNVVVFN